MKWGSIVLATVLAPTGAAGAADTPPGLLRDEIGLHIVTHGIARTPADFITLSVAITSEAATAAAARAAANDKVSRLTAALVARGIDKAAISTQQVGIGPFGFIGNEAKDDDGGARATAMVSALAAARGAAAKRQASVTLKVRLIGKAQLDTANAALDAQDEPLAGAPVASLNDPRPAQRTAIADAVAKARQQADDYAASLGLTVARIVAVSNATPANDIAAFTQVMSAMQGSKRPDQVETTATIAIDYALIAKR